MYFFVAKFVKIELNLVLIQYKMKRRNLLKTATLGIGGLFSMPLWAEGWNQNSFSPSLAFSSADDAFLAEIVETFIPETNTPGAKSLGVHKLLQRLVTDCQGAEAEIKLIEGLRKMNEFSVKNQGAEFVKLDASKKMEVLKAMEIGDDSSLKALYGQLRRMTIDGYMKSEYVIVNIQKYEWAPGRYHGCVPI